MNNIKKFVDSLILLSVFLLLGSCTTSPKSLKTHGQRTPSGLQQTVLDEKFMVASQGYWTSQIAAEILKQGGNAVDAAVAASFMISVERPQSSGLGGGGFMMIYLKDEDEVIAVNFRERAPLLARETMFQNETGEFIAGRSTNGIFAAATPGLVAGLVEVQQKYGRLPLARVVLPAALRAREGFAVYPHLANAIESQKDRLSPAAREVFFYEGNRPLRIGEILRQSQLAETLESIAKNGRAGFYSGPVARFLVKEFEENQGLLRAADLENYSVTYPEPIKGIYRGLSVYSMPPPSSGGVHLVEMLNILSHFDLGKQGPFGAQAIHTTVSAMQRAYADRAQYMGDADMVRVPVAGLISKSYADELAKTMDLQKAQASVTLSGVNPWSFGDRYESDETTHLSVADQNGNMVSTTQTINGWMGSGVLVRGAGFLLNNEMDDFSAKEGVANKFGVTGGAQNAIAGGKRPLSSMTPTIVTKGSEPYLALGTPAGSRIINCVLLTFLNLVEYEMPIDQAISSQRYHHQWLPDAIEVESPGFSPAVTTDLERRGHKILVKDIGCKIQAIAKTPRGWLGASDARGESGLALGSGQAPPVPQYNPEQMNNIPQD